MDDPESDRFFVLTGSQNILRAEKVSQTLAGRTRIFTLSQRELITNGIRVSEALDARMLFGGYPRICDRGLDPREWVTQYYATYVERDVRS